MKKMVQIRRDDIVVCRHCGMIYEILLSTPARDTGSLKCHLCDDELLRWNDAAIPVVAIKETAE
jgi:hypothetical protein